MKQTIPAGTPGIFRPGHGQHPEPDTQINMWVRQAVSKPIYYTCVDSIHVSDAYAWEYMPAPPIVDDFEAWCAKFEAFRRLSYEYDIYRIDFFEAYEEDPEVYELRIGRPHKRTKPVGYPTLLEAQRAAYAHFLESLSTPKNE